MEIECVPNKNVNCAENVNSKFYLKMMQSNNI